ncbi:glycerol-3-phosphate 1-O-acyltransferase PlsY [Pelagibacteraceae bacterium]|nr:glycerol-3-phosphate 1-O-acyltransferase PlsY [Pelagibacteraceae bacterium]
MNIELLYISIYSYILGSIPFGLVLIKIFLKRDIRKIGSGNIGATNVLRAGKKTLGAATLLLDGLKAYVSILITLNISPDYIYLSALFCFLGHVFPIWLKFNGGKGIAVYLGVLFAFSIYLGLIFIISWIIILYISKFSSLSSLVSSLIILLYSITLNDSNMILLFFIIFIIVIYTHRENISRIRDKTENKTNF